MLTTEQDVIILGAGLSGIAMGIALRRVNRHNFLILEEAQGVGGTWWHNRYPGAQCDVPSHLYSFSFAPNPNWSHRYTRGDEIQRYAESCVDQFGLRPHLRLGTRIDSAHFDEQTQRWTITTDSGQQLVARHFIVSMGPLHRPRLPAGIEAFTGPILHTARWDATIDYAGHTVAVIGTAASAVQLVPAIVASCGQVEVFQRTPSWIVPRGDRPYSAREQRWLRIPWVARLYRSALYVGAEAIFPAFRRLGWMHKLMQWVARHHLHQSVPASALRDRLTPNYPMGCKRILLSDTFYPALQQPHVTLHGAASAFAADAIIDEDGQRIPIDLIVCATGFDTLAPLGSLQIHGLEGLSLTQRWSAGPEAYRGTVVDGFPNLWLLLGPNTGTGHTSVLIPIEAQVRYIVDCLDELDRRGAQAMAIQPAVLRQHNEALQRRLARTVWASPGCNSWYKTADGRVLGTYPGFITQFSLSMRKPKFADYHYS